MSAPRHEREVRQARTRQRRRDPFDEGAAAAHARRLRSVGLALALLLFVALIFAVTLLRLGSLLHGSAS